MAKNVTVNKTNECVDIKRILLETPPESPLLKWIALTEAVGIIILNTVLILMLMRLKKKSRMAYFVKHLSIADLFVGLLYVLPNCIFERFLDKWEKYSCFIFFGYCTNVTIFASTFLIVVLTIDRLFVIVRPLSASTKGNRYRYGLVSGAWMLALILTLPYALHIRFSDTCTEHGINICWHDFKHMEAIVLAELFINWIIPVCIIISCYTWIIRVIIRREKFGLPGSPNTMFSHVYISSWTPINLAQVLNVFGIIPAGDLFTVLHVLAPINNLMNPLVFLVFNRQLFVNEKQRISYINHSPCNTMLTNH
ncbi:cardioacceleratory peptide receptor-like isoform X2 [Mytilus edulis]|uniref:cardioacceleratory peptide receptor-like isoform X2 n=1 Tax=Mytilus edulis TaxID=6550 RepID=UPI0039EE40E8